MALTTKHPAVGKIVRTGIGRRQDVEVRIIGIDVENNWVWWQEVARPSNPTDAKRPHEFSPVVDLDA